MAAEGEYRSAGKALADKELCNLQLDSSGNLKVVSGPTGTTANQVQGNVAASAADGTTNPVKTGGRYDASRPVYADGNRTNFQTDSRGALYATLAATDTGAAIYNGGDTGVAAAPSAFANLLGVLSRHTVFDGTNWQAGRGDTNGTYTVVKPVTAGGLSISRLVGATSGVIKASAGQIYTGTFTNTNAAIRYLQIYNKASAGTLSTDTPVLTVPLPPNQCVMIDFDNLGGQFTTGISWQFTTDDIAIPTTAGATTDIHGFASFK
jgi:hypothetical protein